MKIDNIISKSVNVESVRKISETFNASVKSKIVFKKALSLPVFSNDKKEGHSEKIIMMDGGKFYAVSGKELNIDLDHVPMYNLMVFYESVIKQMTMDQLSDAMKCMNVIEMPKNRNLVVHYAGYDKFVEKILCRSFRVRFLNEIGLAHIEELGVYQARELFAFCIVNREDLEILYYD